MRLRRPPGSYHVLRDAFVSLSLRAEGRIGPAVDDGRRHHERAHIVTEVGFMHGLEKLKQPLG